MSAAHTSGSLEVAETGPRALPSELFALSDEQIVGIDPEEMPLTLDDLAREVRSGRTNNARSTEGGTNLAAANGGEQPPAWLAERMKDPWHGEEARAFWESLQKAQMDSAGYREVFASPQEARELKELYPGGLAEAKTAVERARQLEEIDASYFGATAESPEAQSAARTQLAQRLFDQNPAAFRAMVQAGVKLLESRQQADQTGRASVAGNTSDTATSTSAKTAEAGAKVPAAYAEFERSANADLEKTVGTSIARTLQNALPNLSAHTEQGSSLRERLVGSVRENVNAALQSDTQLGEQVRQILAAGRFDGAARAQVVRLIDARAQQLVPTAVRQVVSEWTQATWTSRNAAGLEDRANEAAVTKRTIAPAVANTQAARKNAPAPTAREQQTRGRLRTTSRLDYRQLSDEQILEL